MTAQQAVNALTRNDRFGSWGVLIPWGIGLGAIILGLVYLAAKPTRPSNVY